MTLFGPNNLEWTETGHKDEIRLIGEVACVPCDKLVCKQDRQLWMAGIGAERVCEAVGKQLQSG